MRRLLLSLMLVGLATACSSPAAFVPMYAPMNIVGGNGGSSVGGVTVIDKINNGAPLPEQISTSRIVAGALVGGLAGALVASAQITYVGQQSVCDTCQYKLGMPPQTIVQQFLTDAFARAQISVGRGGTRNLEVQVLRFQFTDAATAFNIGWNGTVVLRAILTDNSA